LPGKSRGLPQTTTCHLIACKITEATKGAGLKITTEEKSLHHDSCALDGPERKRGGNGSNFKLLYYGPGNDDVAASAAMTSLSDTKTY